MKTATHHTIIAALLALLALGSKPLIAVPVGTAFTYQGHLSDGATPATGLYDMRFSIWDALNAGTQLGETLTVSAVPVTNGLFMVNLDFGGVFSGGARWLAISVKTNLAVSYTDLTPRQELTPSPYAVFAPAAGNANLALSVAPGSIVSASLAPGAVTAAAIGAGAVTTPAIAAGSVVNAGLAPNSVTSEKLASDPASLNKVTAGQMADLGTRLVVQNTDAPIDTSLFTGLGFQYYSPTGEGAIMSSYNDGYGFLSFYTKEATGLPLLQRMVIARNGNVGIGTNNPSVVLDVKGIQYITPHGDGVMNVGDTAGYHVTLDNNELHARYRTNASTLYLNDFGGDVYVARDSDTFVSDTLNVYKDVGVGIDTYPAAKLDVYGTRTIGTYNDGIVNIGDSSGYHLTLDNNELHARDGTNVSALYLNDYGGGVWIGNTIYVAYGTAATIYGAATVSGDLRTTGLTRQGSESGTSQAPNPAGMVTRRINSTVTTAGEVVARTDYVTLERDGSNGGFLVRYVASPGYTTVAAMGINSTGAQVNRYFTLANPDTAGTVALYTDAQNVVHFACTFGRTYTSGEHLTQATLSRYVGDWYWMGNVVSTYNQ